MRAPGSIVTEAPSSNAPLASRAKPSMYAVVGAVLHGIGGGAVFCGNSALRSMAKKSAFVRLGVAFPCANGLCAIAVLVLLADVEFGVVSPTAKKITPSADSIARRAWRKVPSAALR